MTELRDRIQNRLKELGKSARRASLEGGLHRDAIRNILRTKSRNPRRDTLEGIARGLNWTMEELLELGGYGNVSHVDQPVFDVPLISWVAAGALGETTEPFEVLRSLAKGLVLAFQTTLVALLAFLPLRKMTDYLMRRLGALEEEWTKARDEVAGPARRS